MPLPSADQGIETPAYPDPADGPAALLAFLAGVEKRLVRDYTSTSDRDSKIPSPDARRFAVTGSGSGMEAWLYNGTAWVRIYPEARDAWTAYTPTITGSTTNPSLSQAVGRYKRAGRHIVAELNVVLSSAGSGVYGIGLPVPSRAVTTDTHLGSAWLYDASSTQTNVGVAVAQSGGTTCQIRAHGVAAAMGSTAPWTWASGDAIRLNLSYEAAS